MTKFVEIVDNIHEKLKKRLIQTAFDNIMGLTYLNGMVDVITITPELREDLHGHIESIIYAMGQIDIPDPNTEYMKDFV